MRSRSGSSDGGSDSRPEPEVDSEGKGELNICYNSDVQAEIGRQGVGFQSFEPR